MFYETKNFLCADNLRIEHGQDFSFPLHLHGSFEFVTVSDGELKVTVDGTEYALTFGKGVLIFPNQAHAFKTEKNSRHSLCIFSPSLVRSYHKGCLSKVPKSNLFSVDNFYVERLKQLGEGSNISEIKGLLYSLCGEFDAAAVYRDRGAERDGLLLCIFNFVEENYQAECDLEALSRALGYNYVYLSRYFKERTGIRFTEYVNRYRVSEACYRIGSTEKSLLSIACECGFSSLRSFNRNFAEIMGTSPSAYRASIGK